MITMIACVDNNWGIGKENKLLAHLPKDLKHFKDTTMNQVCVFGRTTFESLPVQPLPNRINVILTTDNLYFRRDCIVVRSVQDVLNLAKKKHVYICGGGNVYKQFINFADELIITHMEKDFESDTFFPSIDDDKWIPYSCEGDIDNGISFDIIRYKLKKGE